MGDVKEHKKSSVAKLLRWLLVLPAAVGGSLLAAFLLHWVILGTLRYGATIELSPEAAGAVERMLFPLVSAASFVYVGARVAPCSRPAVSIVLTLTLFFLVIGSSILGKGQRAVYVANPGLFVLGAGIGILLTFVTARKEPKGTRKEKGHS